MNLIYETHLQSNFSVSDERKGFLETEVDMGDDTVGAATRIQKLYRERKDGFVRAQEIHKLNY